MPCSSHTFPEVSALHTMHYWIIIWDRLGFYKEGLASSTLKTMISLGFLFHFMCLSHSPKLVSLNCMCIYYYIYTDVRHLALCIINSLSNTRIILCQSWFLQYLKYSPPVQSLNSSTQVTHSDRCCPVAMQCIFSTSLQQWSLVFFSLLLLH